MFCDEVFTPGHQLKHKRTQLLVTELEDEEPTGEEVDNFKEKESIPVECTQYEWPQLSMNALTGISSYQTMRVNGMHNKKILQILVDSGSTHNFLDLELAKKLGCKLEAIPSMTVTAGGGNKLQAPFLCKGFTWNLQQTEFSADVLVLPLGCCDLILWVQWLTSLGPILWDFNKLQMEFSMNGKKFVLRGAKTSGVKLINNKSFSQVVQQVAQMCFLYLDKFDNYVDMPSCNMLSVAVAEHSIPAMIEELIEDYNDIFQEPTQLPPIRPGFDHQIPLKEGSAPCNLRPYRYSIIQKDIVDNLVEEML